MKIFKKNRSAVFWMTLLLVLSFLAFVIYAGLTALSERLNSVGSKEVPVQEPISEKEEDENWLVYQSSEFKFEISYPRDWVALEFPEDPTNPRVNILKSSADSVRHPVTHHSEVSNVSIFPHGIPTEGVFGETRESSVNFSEVTENSLDFILNNGDVWATYSRFRNRPGSWTGAGFIWSKASVSNLESVCLKNGEELSIDFCDPIFGDVTVRKGSVDRGEREIQEKILESFRFLP